MARFKIFNTNDGSNVDPFNAGDPVMPWDDPATQHDGWCEDDDEPYDAPSPDRSAQQAERAAKREQEEARRASNQRKSSAREANDEASAENGDAPAPTSELFERGRRRWEDQSQGASQNGAAARPPKKKLGCIIRACLIVILIELLLNLAGCIGGLLGDIFDTSESAVDILGTLFDDDDDYDYDDEDVLDATDEDDAACVALAQEYLDSLAENEEARALVATEFEGLIEDATDRSAEELGLSSEAFTDWYFENFWYELESVYTWDDGTGTVYFYFLYFDYEAGWNFANSLVDLLSEEDVGDDVALTDEQLASVAELYEEFLEDADLDDSSFDSFEFVYEDGSWTFDEDYLADELKYILDVF